LPVGISAAVGKEYADFLKSAVFRKSQGLAGPGGGEWWSKLEGRKGKKV